MFLNGLTIGLCLGDMCAAYLLRDQLPWRAMAFTAVQTAVVWLWGGGAMSEAWLLVLLICVWAWLCQIVAELVMARLGR